MPVTFGVRRTSRVLGQLGLALMLALGLPAVSAGAVVPAASSSLATTTIYQGGAWGSTVLLDGAVRSDHTAPVTLSCATRPGTTSRNTVTSTRHPGVFHTGGVNNTAAAIAHDGLQTARETSTVRGLWLVDGIVTARVVKAVSRTTRHPDGSFTFSTAGSEFRGLVIDGQAMSERPEHRVVEVPGFGRVTVFAHDSSVKGTTAQQFVNMLVIDVLHENDQGIPVGTRIVIAHALSKLSRATGALGGRAWGSQLEIGGTVASQPSFVAYLPCAGTGGVVRRQSGAATTLPAPIRLGIVTSTATGTVGAHQTSGETTSRIVDVNLGAGQIVADLIKADAAVTGRDGEKAVFDTSGSHFGGLVIGGQAQSGSPEPNTVVEVPNLGRVILNQVTRGTGFVVVRMLHLEVLEANPNFPVGTDLVLGYARVSIRG